MDIDTHATGSPAPLFRHEALLYAGEEDFLAGVSAFVRQGLAAGEPTLVAVERAKLDRLRDRLGNEGELVRWVDLTLIGRNPARITSLWYEFATAHGWQGSPTSSPWAN